MASIAVSRDVAIRSPPPTNWSGSATKSSVRNGVGALVSNPQTGTKAAHTNTGVDPRSTGAQKSSSGVRGSRVACHKTATSASTTAPARTSRCLVISGVRSGTGIAGAVPSGAARNSGTYVPLGSSIRTGSRAPSPE